MQPPCTHEESPGDGFFMIIIVLCLALGTGMGFVVGNDTGYRDAVDQGYCR